MAAHSLIPFNLLTMMFATFILTLKPFWQHRSLTKGLSFRINTHRAPYLGLNKLAFSPHHPPPSAPNLPNTLRTLQQAQLSVFHPKLFHFPIHALPSHSLPKSSRLHHQLPQNDELRRARCLSRQGTNRHRTKHRRLLGRLYAPSAHVVLGW